jgi:hypothetical protein
MAKLISIDGTRFNDDRYIESRVATIAAADRGSLRTALGYLYLDNGPVNLPRARLLVAKQHLEVAETIVVQWLYTRTNGSLRRCYGAAALRAARACRYHCEVCGFADVRVLNLDHVNGRVADTPFACLCANCHTIKSRESDWTGEKSDHAGNSPGQTLDGQPTEGHNSFGGVVPLFSVSRAGQDRIEGQASDAGSWIAALRAMKRKGNHSWVQLRLGCRYYLGDNVSAGNPSILASAKLFARKAAELPDMSYQQLIDWLDANGLG